MDVDDEEFVRRLYLGLLGRPADPSGLENFLRLLADGQDPKTVFAQIYDSEERALRLADTEALRSSRPLSATDPVTAFHTHHHRRVLAFLERLTPVDVIGFGKRRIGRDNDGGYVMIDDFAGISTAYSLGISDDVSWDKDLADEGMIIYQYDHSIEALPQNHVNFRWSKNKIAASTDIEKGTISLSDVVERNAADGFSDSVLKVDIEGAEWDVFKGIASDFLGCFRQIVCELHWLHGLADDDRYHQMFLAVKNMTHGHNVVHIHGNNCAPWSIIGGIAIPDVLEITLARKNKYNFQASNSTFPTSLDQPNTASAADFQLGSFRFGPP